MAATTYGYDAGDYKARPDFTARRDAKGGWTASNSFSMLRDTWENSVRGYFAKGTLITALYPELSEYWSFLVLDEVEVSHEPGAISIVRCQWVGFLEASFGDDPEELDDAIYTLSGTRVDRSVLLHPLYLKEVLNNDALDSRNKASVAAAWQGKWQINTNATNTFEDFTIVNTADMGRELRVTETEVVKWLRVILEQGVKTYKAPTLQWTVETTSKDGWKDADLKDLGLVEFNEVKRPPGEPPMPENGDFEWLKISMSQTKTEGQTRQSQSWELSPAGGFHKFPAPDEDEGLYDYDLEIAEA